MVEQELKNWLEKGNNTIYLVLNHISKSKIKRWINVYCLVCENGKVEAYFLDHLIAPLLKWKFDHRGLEVKGAGMDIGLHLAMTLSKLLYNKSDAIKYRWL